MRSEKKSKAYPVNPDELFHFKVLLGPSCQTKIFVEAAAGVTGRSNFR